jgi:hypothetical protein
MAGTWLRELPGRPSNHLGVGDADGHRWTSLDREARQNQYQTKDQPAPRGALSYPRWPPTTPSWLAGEPVTTPWDPSLADAMARRDVRIEEELSLDTLLADLT